MTLPDFASLPLAANLGVFAAAAAVVWFAGVKLTAYEKVISERTGAEQALLAYAGGLVVLFSLR